MKIRADLVVLLCGKRSDDRIPGKSAIFKKSDDSVDEAGGSRHVGQNHATRIGDKTFLIHNGSADEINS